VASPSAESIPFVRCGAGIASDTFSSGSTKIAARAAGLVLVTSQVAGGAYRRLLAQPVLRRIAVADVCARVPQGMTSITLLLVVAEHAPMTVAGLALAGYTLGAAVTAPARGRLADRRGLFPVSAVCGAGYAAALLGLLACSLARSPAGLLVVGATAAGLLLPPLSPGVRSLWSSRAQAGLWRAAFALDAAVFDLSAIAGPVVASALATGVAPAAALGVVLVLTGAAVVAVGVRAGPAQTGTAGMPSPGAEAGRGDAGGRSLLGPLRSAALRRLLVTAAFTNLALSATEVALIAYARDHHALWASGPLLAGVAAGSIAGSLLLGVRGAEVGARLPRLLGCYALGLCGLVAASTWAPLLAVAAPVAGLCLGPALATLFSAAAAAAPRGNGTETQAWINSIMNGGAAAGAALAGLTASQPAVGLSLAAGAAAAAAASALLARSRDNEKRHEPA
jgi:MFS family permease